MSWRMRIILIAAASCFVVFLLLVAMGRIRAYTIPTTAMHPTIARNETVFMEGITYFFHAPRIGEIVVFKTDGIESLKEGTFYVKRIAGKPGDTLRIADGKLYVNDKHLPLANAAGEITYTNFPNSPFLSSPTKSITVPEGHYFVLGDNSPNSADSRMYGSIPAKNIRGRILWRQ